MSPRSLLLFTAALAAMTACTRHGAGSDGTVAMPAIRVRIEKVSIEAVVAVREIAGIVRPVRHATVAARLMGSIEEMPVVLGQSVRAGEVLVRISAGEVSARLAQAKAQLGQANFDLARERELLSKNASTADLVHSLETRVALSEAMVTEAESFLSYSVIRAPFDGVVSRKFAEIGDLASPGMPLLDVDGTGRFQVESDIPDSLAGALKLGVSVEVRIPSSGESYSARLSELSSAADPNAHTVSAEFAVPAGVASRAGQFARLQIPGPPVRALLAKASAVSRDGQMERVFVAGADHRAVLRLVKTGAMMGDRVEILSGVDDGESVVLAPPVGLREGEPLEVEP